MSEPIKEQVTEVVLCGGGKYSVHFEQGTGRLYARRYGLPWRDLCGDNLVLSLMQEVQHFVPVKGRLFPTLVALLEVTAHYLPATAPETKWRVEQVQAEAKKVLEANP